MDSSTQNEGENGGEDKDVRQIIDQLKSQGLFDQFRKDLLADVDTKPAYQNLNQRVEGYVNRFLSRQIWSPRLNKNQLRDNLRRQINQSGMLINGVERVINQVVDPKILQVIKPKIDEVVCSYFGIDLKERQRQLETHKQQQKQKLQSLMNLNVTPPGNVQDKTEQQSDPSMMKSNTTFPPGFPPDVWQQQLQQQSILGFPGGMMNFPMATPFPQQMAFGMSPQVFPNMQNTWNNFMFPPMSGQMTSVPMVTSTTNSVTTSVTVTTSAVGSTTPTMSTNTADEVSPPKPDLPPLPPTPPPPGTEEEAGEDSIKPKVLDDIPLPPTVPKGEVVEEEEVPSLDEIPLPPPSDTVEGEDTVSKRPYKFAWEDNDVDAHSDITVSSVHTSDLSEFEDDVTTESELEYSDLTDHGNDEEDEEEEEEKKEDKEDVLQTNKTTADEKEVAESEVPDSKLEEDNDKPPILEAVLETVPPVLEPEPVVTMVTEDKASPQETDELPPEITSESETFVVEAEVTAMGGDYDYSTVKNDAAAPPVLKSIEEIQSEEAKEEAPTLESVTMVAEGGNEVVEEQITFEAIVQNIQTEQGMPECAIVGTTTTEGNMSQSAISARMAELDASIQDTLVNEVSPPKKKLVSLQYNYSDSDDEETREERRARIAKEKEERYQKRQQRRAELEAKRKERDLERLRLKEERKKAKEKAAQETKEDTGERKEENEAGLEDSSHKESADNSTSSPTRKIPEFPDKRLKQPRSPEKKTRKSKAELKEERVKQKVMEKKAALRRQRTRNRRYTSEEFTSIFNEKQQPYTSQSYSELVMEEQVVEETVSTTDYSMEVTVDYPGVDVEQTVEDMYSQMPGTPTQDEAPEPVSPNISTLENVNRGLRTRVRGSDDNQDVEDVRSEETKKGSKRKRAESETMNEDDSKAVDSELKTKQAKIEDDKSLRSTKRYNASDLYKPRPSITRGTRRRGSSPTAFLEASNVSAAPATKGYPKPQRPRTRGPKPKLELPPEDEIIEITSRSPTPQPRSKSYSRSRSHSRSRSYSASRSRSRSHSHSHSRSRSSHKKKKRRKRKKKVKKRSRSRSGSAPPHIRDGASPISSSSLSISESSRSRHSSRSSRSGSRSSRSKSKSRSRSRSSESSVDEFGRRKRKGSLPLDYVDFGEAAKMARRSLVGVDFGEAERRSKQERTTVPGMFGMPAPGPAENPYNVNQRRPFRKRGGFQQNRGSRGVPKTNALRKNWFQGGWQYQDGSSTGQTSGSDIGMRNSPPMSPSRRYYGSDMPMINDDLESLSPESDEDLSPHEQQRRYRAVSQPSPPYGSRGRLSPVSMYPYDDPEMSPTHMRGQSPIYMRDRSPSPLSPHHIPGRRPMSPLSPRMRVRRSPSNSPPPPHVRMHRSDSPPSPPYVRGRRSLSPISPTHMRRRSISNSPPPRSQSPFSPPHLRGHRSPSPIPRGAARGMMPPSPTAYSHRRRGISPPHPAMRGHRSPTPEEYPMYRSPSPMHRPVTRGYHSPAHSLTPPHMSKSPSPPHRPITRGYSPTRSPSPPSRPVTRGKRASSPLAKGSKKSQQVPLSPPMVGMSSRLRAKHTAPDRYSPTPTQKSRQRPPSPSTPQGKSEKKKR